MITLDDVGAFLISVGIGLNLMALGVWLWERRKTSQARRELNRLLRQSGIF